MKKKYKFNIFYIWIVLLLFCSFCNDEKVKEKGACIIYSNYWDFDHCDMTTKKKCNSYLECVDPSHCENGKNTWLDIEFVEDSTCEAEGFNVYCGQYPDGTKAYTKLSENCETLGFL
jgi:hypothetical protein